MRCKTCEYPLWNMSARRCPECGREFSPREFTFTPNSVKFCCPRCDQAYYGTTEEGHLIPSSFVCVGCGQPVSEDEMVVRPAAGVSEETIQGGVVPWRDPLGQYSRVGAWFRTAFQGLFLPNRLARSAGQEARLGSSWAFFFVTTGVYWVGLVALILVMVVYTQTVRLGIQLAFTDILRGIMFGVLWIAGGPVVLAALTLAWAGTTHLVICSKARMPFGATLECFLFASAGLALMAAPCVGVYMVPVGMAWMAVSAILQLNLRQSAGGGRTVLAVLVFPAVLMVILVGLIGWAIFMDRYSTVTYSNTYATTPTPAAVPASPSSGPPTSPVPNP